MNTVTTAKGTAAPAASASAGRLPLPYADMGEPHTVLAVRGNSETKRFLSTLGFVEGAQTKVVSRLGDNMIIDIKGSRIAVGQSMAVNIMVGA